MDWVIIVLLILIGAVLGLLLFGNKLTIPSKNIRSTAVKKDEILAQYKKELQNILSQYDDKDEQVKQKKLFLHKVTSELSRNIYFTPEQNKQIIQTLASL